MIASLALCLALWQEPGLVAEYYDTGYGFDDFPKPTDLKWLFLRRIETKIDHAPTDRSFGGSRIADNFAVRWSGLLRVPAEGQWTFYLESDDGSRLTIDGEILIDHGGLHGMTEKTGLRTLSAGDHPIVVDYFDRGGSAGIRLSWSGPNQEKAVVESFAHHATPRKPAPEELKMRWKLDPNQYARYRLYRPETANGDELLYHDPHNPVGLFGYELQDQRAYVTDHQIFNEVPLILGFTLPERPLKKTLDLDAILDRGWDYEPIRARGKYERTKTGHTISAKLVSLKAKNVEARRRKVQDGSFEAEVDFDHELQVVTRLRFTCSVTFEGEKPYEWTREMRLVDVLTRRHSSFEAEVNRAIDLGVERVWKWLDDKTKRWGAHYDFVEGPTALALLTILKGSVEKKDPRIDEALKWLLDQPQQHTYSTAIAMMVLEAYGCVTPEHKKWMAYSANWMLGNLRDSYWAYPSGTQDYSNTQYAVLGLFAAQRCGVEIDDRALVGVVQKLLQCQEQKGPGVKLSLLDERTGGTVAEQQVPALGWSYRQDPADHDGPYASMTLGCVGALTILDAMLAKSARYKADLRQKVKQAIRSGWGWLASHWTVKANYHHGFAWTYYTLYGLERAAMLGGIGTVNGHDWYWEGAVWLVANMAGDGAWCDHGYVNLYDTCFAVLFLKRATPRVASGEKK